MRANLLANGIHLPLPLDVAADVLRVLVQLGRTTPPGPWVEHLRRQAEEANEAMLPHSQT